MTISNGCYWGSRCGYWPEVTSKHLYMVSISSRNNVEWSLPHGLRYLMFHPLLLSWVVNVLCFTMNYPVTPSQDLRTLPSKRYLLIWDDHRTRRYKVWNVCQIWTYISVSYTMLVELTQNKSLTFTLQFLQNAGKFWLSVMQKILAQSEFSANVVSFFQCDWERIN